MNTKNDNINNSNVHTDDDFENFKDLTYDLDDISDPMEERIFIDLSKELLGYEKFDIIEKYLILVHITGLIFEECKILGLVSEGHNPEDLLYTLRCLNSIEVE